MYERGDRVRVEGFGGQTATLRVWEELGRGLVLCSEDGYERLTRGDEAPLVGFPWSNIKGLVPDADGTGESGMQSVSQT